MTGRRRRRRGERGGMKEEKEMRKEGRKEGRKTRKGGGGRISKRERSWNPLPSFFSSFSFSPLLLFSSLRPQSLVHPSLLPSLCFPACLPPSLPFSFLKLFFLEFGTTNYPYFSPTSFYHPSGSQKRSSLLPKFFLKDQAKFSKLLLLTPNLLLPPSFHLLPPFFLLPSPSFSSSLLPPPPPSCNNAVY